jgi:hypothetical protein
MLTSSCKASPKLDRNHTQVSMEQVNVQKLTIATRRTRGFKLDAKDHNQRQYRFR